MFFLGRIHEGTRVLLSTSSPPTFIEQVTTALRDNRPYQVLVPTLTAIGWIPTRNRRRRDAYSTYHGRAGLGMKAMFMSGNKNPPPLNSEEEVADFIRTKEFRALLRVDDLRVRFNPRHAPDIVAPRITEEVGYSRVLPGVHFRGEGKGFETASATLREVSYERSLSVKLGKYLRTPNRWMFGRLPAFAWLRVSYSVNWLGDINVTLSGSGVPSQVWLLDGQPLHIHDMLTINREAIDEFFRGNEDTAPEVTSVTLRLPPAGIIVE